ncbi:MAG: zinc-binding dehydrogenase [Deltaproteobacteria bacterium]|nr:zinc-binding dehydrogenase [Deltaproteobacteria bacterium]
MMKAIVIPKHGEPEVFEERQLPDPELKPTEVLIEVEAAGVNFADIMGRMGLYPDAPKLPFAPGYEVAGCVIQTGSQVTTFQVGESVFALTPFWGYADQVKTDYRFVYKLPSFLKPDQAAAIPVNFLTAYLTLFDMGNARRGERVLILMGAGGVGTAAIQMARERGLEIFATCGSSAKVEFLKKLGVQHPINYQEQDYLEIVPEKTHGKGVDLILDPITGSALRKHIKLLAPLGRIVVYGASSLVTHKKRNIVSAAKEMMMLPFVHPMTLMQRNIGISGINLGRLWHLPERCGAAMGEILKEMEGGKVKPILSEKFALTAKGAAQAHHYIQDRKNIGKVLLTKSVNN